MHALIVDDSSAIRTVARRILERFDFDVTEAEDTQAGLEAYRKHAPDLVWLDLHIRGRTEFLATLHGLRRRISKLIVCTIDNDDPEIEGALRAGADGFILKPFDRESLEAALHEIGLLNPRPTYAAV